MFEAFVTTPPIGKYDIQSIMGDLHFIGVKLMTHGNDKTRNPIGRK